MKEGYERGISIITRTFGTQSKTCNYGQPQLNHKNNGVNIKHIQANTGMIITMVNHATHHFQRVTSEALFDAEPSLKGFSIQMWQWPRDVRLFCSTWCLQHACLSSKHIVGAFSLRIQLIIQLCESCDKSSLRIGYFSNYMKGMTMETGPMGWRSPAWNLGRIQSTKVCPKCPTIR
jgi:hypothetical protein